MSRLYGVTMPIAGTAYIELQANSAEEAINKALEEIGMEHIENWEVHRQLMRGNVMSFSTNEASAEDLGEDE